MRLLTEPRCKVSGYRDSSWTFWHKATSDCFVTYSNPEYKTWYEAAAQCMKIGGHIAVFHSTSDVVSFYPVADLKQQCHWIGLVKKFFYWTVIQRKFDWFYLFICSFSTNM